MYAKVQKLHPHTERVYVEVTSTFDATGHLSPISLAWKDGRVFKIDCIDDFRPASAAGLDLPGDCYTVEIQGQRRQLFFERTNPLFRDRIGRWFVEVPSAG